MTNGEWIGIFDIYLTIFWCVAYIECIRIGFKQKTYCMPFFAICMNFGWETLSLIDYIICDGTNTALYFTYGV